MGEAANIVLESAEAVAKGLNKKEKGILGVQLGLLGFLRCRCFFTPIITYICTH